VSRKLTRLLLVASLAAGFGIAPLVGANAAGQTRGVDVYNPPHGFDSGNQSDPTEIQVDIGDNVAWYVHEGTHNITPVDEKAWGQKGSGDLDVNTNPPYTAVHFDKPGRFVYYSRGEATIDKSGKCTGMCGAVLVRDPNATTTSTTVTTSPPATQPPTTVTTAHPTPPGTTATTAPAPAGPAAAHAPTTAAPAPTTTTAKAEKGPKGETSTTTTAPPPPVNLPDSAIIPTLPSADPAATTAVQDGAVAQAPASTPEGDAVALLKDKPQHNAMKLLIVTGIGIGALGIGTASYKFAHRSSKYFPA